MHVCIWYTCVCIYVRCACVFALPLSLSFSRHSVNHFLGARVLSILAPLRLLHQRVVSVQQAGTPRTCLSLWQCSDRATHLSTDALPVSGGVMARARLCLSLFPLAPPPVRALSHPFSLSLLLTLHHPLDTLLIHHPRVLSLSLSHSYPTPLFVLLAPRLESLSG